MSEDDAPKQDAWESNVPRATLRDTNLSMGARLLYGILSGYINKHGQCSPGMKRLQGELGIKTKRSVIRYVQELERAGWIGVERRKVEGKKENATNLYTLYRIKGCSDTHVTRGRDTGVSSDSLDTTGGDIQVTTPDDTDVTTPSDSGVTQRVPIQDTPIEEKESGGESAPEPAPPAQGKPRRTELSQDEPGQDGQEGQQGQPVHTPTPDFEPSTVTGIPDGESYSAGGNTDAKQTKPKPKRKGKPRDPNLDEPAYKAYHEIVRRHTPEAVRPLIVEAVGDEPDDVVFWRAVITAWLAVGWNPSNASGMLDCYRRREIPTARKERTNGRHRQGDGKSREKDTQAGGGFRGVTEADIEATKAAAGLVD